MFGYHKKLLRVNLSERKTEVEDLDEELIRKYIGGVGIEAKILYDETGPENDPLSPENLLMAVTGPCSGTGVPTSGRQAPSGRSLSTDWALRGIECWRLMGSPLQKGRIRRDRRPGKG